MSGVNLKIAKTGGLREMRRMIHAARARSAGRDRLDDRETSLALSAAAQLAPLVDFSISTGTGCSKDDPFDGAPRERGVLELNDRPGLGVVWREGARTA